MVRRQGMSAVAVRPMEPQDIPAAAALEATAPDSWSEASIAATLGGAHAHCYMAEWDGAPAGLCLCDAVLDEASLYAVTVAPEHRRRGIAAALLARLCAGLAAGGIRVLFLEVRSRNAPALALYEKLGFIRTGLRRGFYSAPPDDAVLMEKALLPPGAQPEGSTG